METGENAVEVVIGIDAHTRTHTMVICDAMGRQLAVKTVPATSDGHLLALDCAARWPQRRWAVEDCRHLTRRLEADLLRAGETLARVPIKLMVDTRRTGREPGKSDPIDALAVARAAWREPGLPTARLDGPQRELRLLVDHRDDLVRERTRMQSRIRCHLHELDPELIVRPRGLRSQRTVDRVLAELDGRDGLLAELARELLWRVRELNQRAIELQRRITRIVYQRVGTAAPRNQSGAPTRPASGSPARATAKSTPRCTASRSPRPAPRARRRC